MSLEKVIKLVVAELRHSESMPKELGERHARYSGHLAKRIEEYAEMAVNKPDYFDELYQSGMAGFSKAGVCIVCMMHKLKFVSGNGNEYFFTVKINQQDNKSAVIFNRLMLSIPIEERRMKDRCFIECSPEIEQWHRDALIGRNTPLGEQAREGKQLYPFGFKLVSNPDIRVPETASIVDLSDK